MRKAIVFIALAFLLALCAAPVYAIPPLPHAFYGDVTIKDDGVIRQAPAGTTTIEARGDGVLTPIEGNPVTTSELGKYGSTTFPELDLFVQGDITTGTEISFFVNGICVTDENGDFVTRAFQSGETTKLDLTLVITDESITCKTVKTIPAWQPDYVIETPADAGTTITVSTTAEVTITVKKYCDNPHPECALPVDMLTCYIDIKVDDATAIDWPMYVKQTYTDDDVAGLDEASLGMYYFKTDDSVWHRCSDTSANTTANYVSANMTEEELPESPVAIGGTALPPAPVPARGRVGSLPAPAPPAGTTDVRGLVSTAGVFLRSVVAVSKDGLLTFTIPRGTVGLTEELEPLTEIIMVTEDKPPPPPEDAYIVGLAYDFRPDGATFDPAITLEYPFDPAEVPEGVAEEDLVVECYEKETGEWEECISSVDTKTHTVTASIDHFTCFAVIAPPIAPLPPTPAAFSVSNLSIQPAEVQPEEAVTITVSVANTGGTKGSYTVVLMIDGVKEVEKRVTVAAADSQLVSFSVSKEEAGSYSVVVNGLRASFTVVAPAPPVPAPPAPAPPVKPPFNWPLVGGIMAAVVVLTLLVFFFVIRPRAY